jgi:Phage integrase, N-terminal SAM-like domain
MSTAAPSTALATIQPAFTDAERLALAGFLAGYRGLTRDAYALDLRQFTTWCRARSVALFAVRRSDIEGFARELEARGRARATITRRLCTIAEPTSTPSKRNSWTTRPLRMSAVRGWTTSPTRSRWTATSSAGCWSLLGSARRLSMRYSHCRP